MSTERAVALGGAGEGDERAVADGMPLAVVDRLEAVDVEVGEGEVVRVTAAALDLARRGEQEGAPIGDAGELVGERLLPEARHQAAQLGEQQEDDAGDGRTPAGVPECATGSE